MLQPINIASTPKKETYDPKKEQVVLPGSDKKTNSKQICFIPVDIDVEDN